MLNDIFNKALDNSLDVSERTTEVILSLQNLIDNREYMMLEAILTHHKTTELSPSVMLGMLFITENIEPLKVSWNKLNNFFVSINT